MAYRAAVILVLAILFSWSSPPVGAQPPAGYYDNVNDATPASLRQSLHTIIKTGAIVRSYTDVISVLQDANQDPNNAQNIILIYSGLSVNKTWDSGTTWNREHVFPQSRFGDGVSPYFTDVHALMPTVPTINGRRGNSPFGVVPVGGNPDAYGNKLGTGLGGFTVFEPRDGAKGDIARALFYMDIRYEGTGGELNLQLIDTNPGFGELGRLTELIQWHTNDPPDAFEIRRNNRLFAAQNNRNPFIDYPQFVDCIYLGTCTGDFATPSAPTGLAATPGVGYIDLSWNPNTESDLAGYRVFRSESAAGPFNTPLTEIAPPFNFFRDSTISPGTPTYYHVTAFDSDGNESGLSNQATAASIVDDTAPAAPTGFGVFAGNGFLFIQWDANSENDLAGYRLYRSTTTPPTDLYQSPGASASGFLDESVTNGTRYYYLLTAVDTSGNESEPTEVRSAVPGIAGTGCGIDLILSEYAKGTVGFNRALELFNPTGAAIDLSAYTIDMHSGASLSPVVTLSLEGRGVVPPLGTFVIVHQAATDPDLLSRADMSDQGNSLWFNGDDPIVLRRGDTVVDSIGQVGSAAIYGNNITLRRKPDVFLGRTNPASPFTPDDEWTSHPVNTWSGFGSHETSCVLLVGATATIDLLDPVQTNRDAVRFEVEFSEPVDGLFDLQAVELTGTLANSATAALAGTDPVYLVVVFLEDPNEPGTIGIAVGGGGLDQVEGGFTPVASPLYTITATLAGDINGDGVVNVADVTALATSIVDGTPPSVSSPE
jgi:endonuclease I